MGILNVTPDSFYDGGQHAGLRLALARAWEMVDEGADVLDLGGESTRPGAASVTLTEELARVVPVVTALVADSYPLPISLDTSRARVARDGLAAGAVIINDVTGGTREPAILDCVAAAGAAVVLMHMRGTPQTMQGKTGYDDVTAEVCRTLSQLCEAASRAGIPVRSQCVDPGVGFAKTAADSLRLCATIERLAVLDRPILVGASRKSFLGHLFDQHGEDRLAGSLAVAGFAALHGAEVLRVHDVRATRAHLNVTMALQRARNPVTDMAAHDRG